MSRVLRDRTGARPSRAAASTAAPTLSGAEGSRVQSHCESGKWLNPQPKPLLPYPRGLAWEQTCREGQCRGCHCSHSVSAAPWSVPELAHPILQSCSPAPQWVWRKRRNDTGMKVVPLSKRHRALHPSPSPAQPCPEPPVRDFSPSECY